MAERVVCRLFQGMERQWWIRRTGLFRGIPVKKSSDKVICVYWSKWIVSQVWRNSWKWRLCKMGNWKSRWICPVKECRNRRIYAYRGIDWKCWTWDGSRDILERTVENDECGRPVFQIFQPLADRLCNPYRGL